MVHFQDAITDSYKKFVVLTWALCMPEEQWISKFIWHHKIMVVQCQPRAMIFVLTPKTRYPWFHIVSYLLCIVYSFSSYLHITWLHSTAQHLATLYGPTQHNNELGHMKVFTKALNIKWVTNDRFRKTLV